MGEQGASMLPVPSYPTKGMPPADGFPLPSNVPDVQKLYFRDPGLAAYLAGIRDPKEISGHPLRNALFETLIIAELEKYCSNYGKF